MPPFYFLPYFDVFIRATHLCHCERSVAISRKGILVKAMMRCFCLWQKRCTFGATCAFGTLRINNIFYCEAHTLVSFRATHYIIARHK